MGNGSRNWLVWTLAGAASALYVIGRQQRTAHRIPSLGAIEESGAVEAYDRVSQLPQFRYMRSRFAAHAVRGRQGARVLDVGCGAGLLDVELARRREVAEVTGIDLSDTQIHHARTRAERVGVDARFLLADASELPFPDASFDVVVSTLSMHHWEQPVMALREIQRVLAPGGSMYLLDVRRDVATMFLGWVTLVTNYVMPQYLRENGEPLGSFQAAYTPCEAVLYAAKAGWSDPRIINGPFWFILEADKGL